MGYGGMNDGMEGDMDPDPCYGGRSEDPYEYYSHDNSVRVTPKYQFNSDEDLFTSEVFQRQLTMALAHKDKMIDGYREELLALMLQQEILKEQIIALLAG